MPDNQHSYPDGADTWVDPTKVNPETEVLSDGELKATDEGVLSDELRAALQMEQETVSAQKSGEFEMTPEIETQIMDKVQDINEYGTAFSVITDSDDRLSSILKYGILGTSRKQDHIKRAGFYNENNVQHYLKALKDHPEVFFNIIGRVVPVENYYNIARYFKPHLSVIFSLKPWYKDNSNENHRRSDWDKDKNIFVDRGTGHLEKRSFYANGHADLFAPNDKGESLAESDIGFMLSPRVAPKLFRGIVVRPPKVEEPSDEQVELMKESEHIARMQTTVNQNRPNLFVPIYDTRGNLWWPKQMSYESVKAFVAERDGKQVDNPEELETVN